MEDAKCNSDGYIVALNSSGFLENTTNWIEIDSGFGDRYYHAQGNYLPETIVMDGGIFRYKLENGKPMKCTAEEIRKQREDNMESDSDGLELRLAKLETSSKSMRQTLEAILSKIAE